MRIRYLTALAAVLMLCGCGTVPASTNHAPIPHNSAPVSAPVSTPAPVSTTATLFGICVPGMKDDNSNQFYTLSETPPPSDSLEIFYGYQVTFTNNSQATAHITGWALAFYNSSGAEITSVNKTLGVDGFITPGQTLYWNESPWNSVSEAPFAIGQSGAVDPTVTCSVIQWYQY